VEGKELARGLQRDVIEGLDMIRHAGTRRRYDLSAAIDRVDMARRHAH
jgi:hypothetical protein